MADDNPQGGQDKLDGLQKLLAKKDGDAMAVAALLYSETHDLREKNRQLKEKLPADGSVVLSKEDAADYEAFKALNLKPADVKSKVESHDAVAAENVKLKRAVQFGRLVEAGYSLPALETLDELEGKEIESYELKEETKDNKTVKSGVVKVGGKELSLDDYAKEKRPAIAQILKSGGNGAQGGTPYVAQDAGGRAPATDVYTKIRQEEEDKKKNRKPTNLLDERFSRATA